MIGFRVDGNQTIGMGHYVRCAAIAGELSDHGEQVLFIIASDADEKFIREQNLSYYRLKNGGKNGWDAAEVCELIDQRDITTLIVDTYRIDQEDFRQLKKHCRTIYIDDLDTYECEADAIINFNPGAEEEKYGQGGKQGRRIYAGVRYYPLRKFFLLYRKETLNKQVRRVLITSGSTDPYQCVKKIIYAICPDDWLQIQFSLLEGAFFPEEYKTELRETVGKYRNVKPVPWSKNVADLLRNYDLVISSGSSTVLEALSMNVPCITYQFAENHRQECAALQTEGMADWAGNILDEQFAETVRRLFEVNLAFEEREKKAGKYLKQFDGKGLERIANCILAEKKT